VFDILAEVLPQACEAFLLQVTRATPEQIQSDGEIYVIVPIPRALLDEDPDLELTTEHVKRRMYSVFRPYLKNVHWYEEGVIEDVEGNVVFDLSNQDMRAMRFLFRVPKGIFEEDHL
jgi:hypothetical protein